MAAVNKIWQDQCLNMVKTGGIDGCFVDGCTRIPGPLDNATLANYTRNKPEMLAALQAQLPGVLICGSNGDFYDGMLGTQLQNWGSHGGNYSTREIPALQRAVAAGVMFQAHGNIGQVCRNGGDPDNAAVQTELAAFLVAAGPHSYYMCGDFKTSKPVWLPVYDKKLGAPLGNATLTDGVYTRSFASGTTVTYDTRTETGTIKWA